MTGVACGSGKAKMVSAVGSLQCKDPARSPWLSMRLMHAGEDQVQGMKACDDIAPGLQLDAIRAMP